MSDGERIPLEQAQQYAGELVGLIGGYCSSIKIAGSIRRQKPTIGDIDLVVEPWVGDVLDMFGEPSGEKANLTDERIAQLVAERRLTKRLDKNGRPAWGEQLKRAVYRGLSVDIQSVTDPDTWGMWFLIRTGPADFNRRIVTPRWRGGLLPPGMEVRDGFQLWRMGARVPTPTELSVFEAYGLDYVEPGERQ